MENGAYIRSPLQSMVPTTEAQYGAWYLNQKPNTKPNTEPTTEHNTYIKSPIRYMVPTSKTNTELGIYSRIRILH